MDNLQERLDMHWAAQRERLPESVIYDYVYLMDSYESGIYKIGISQNPKRRLSQMSEAKSILKSWRFDSSQEAATCERLLHNHFLSFKVNRDWRKGFTELFALPDNQVRDLVEMSHTYELKKLLNVKPKRLFIQY